MSLFSGRAQRPIPEEARALLSEIPGRFVDDGCSNAPDGLFGFRFRWACRIHDWYGCTRAWPAGALTLTHMREGDRMLRRFVGESLPLRWRWVKWIYYAVVKRLNGDVAFDSCGPDVGVVCRHNLPMPEWMRG